MTDKELHKLKRAELLEMMIEQGREIERLQARLAEAEAKLAKRELLVAQAGSIAEASLAVHEIFEAAQRAADQYLENVKRVAAEQEGTDGAEAEQG